MTLARVLALIGLVLAFVSAAVPATLYFSPMTSHHWVDEIHEKDVKLETFPRNFLFVRVEFDINEVVRGNVTFFQDRVSSFELVPKCYILTTDGFNSRSSNLGWLNQAVYKCSEALYYEPLQYGRAKYVRYFAFRANSTEYYFVLAFEPGDGVLYLSRLKAEVPYVVNILVEASYVTGVVSAIALLLSFSLERRRKRKH